MVTRLSRSIDYAQREALARLISQRGESFHSISRILGRNPTYIQQFMKRGSPRCLCEEDRNQLAHYFGVQESALGGPQRDNLREASFIQIPILDTRQAEEAGRSGWALQSNVQKLAIFSVSDTVLAPEVIPGDEVVIDRQDSLSMLRDGLYAVQRDSITSIRRVRISAHQHNLAISGNDWSILCPVGRPPDNLTFLGRVVWIGRRP